MPITPVQKRADWLQHYREHFTVIFGDARLVTPLVAPWPGRAAPAAPPAPAVQRWRVTARVKTPAQDGMALPQQPAEAPAWRGEALSPALIPQAPNGLVGQPPVDGYAGYTAAQQAPSGAASQPGHVEPTVEDRAPEPPTWAPVPDLERAGPGEAPPIAGALPTSSLPATGFLPAPLAPLPPEVSLPLSARAPGEMEAERRVNTVRRSSGQLSFSELLAYRQQTEAQGAPAPVFRSPPPVFDPSLVAGDALPAPEAGVLPGLPVQPGADQPSSAADVSADPFAPRSAAPPLQQADPAPLGPTVREALPPVVGPAPRPGATEPLSDPLSQGQLFPGQLSQGPLSSERPAGQPLLSSGVPTPQVDRAATSAVDVPGQAERAAVAPTPTALAAAPASVSEAQPVQPAVSQSEPISPPGVVEAEQGGAPAGVQTAREAETAAVQSPAPEGPVSPPVAAGSQRPGEAAATASSAPPQVEAVPGTEEGEPDGPPESFGRPYRTVDADFTQAALKAAGPLTPDVQVILPRRARPVPFVPGGKKAPEPEVVSHSSEQVQDWLARLNRVADGEANGEVGGRPLSLAELLTWDKERPRAAPGANSTSAPTPQESPSPEQASPTAPGASSAGTPAPLTPPAGPAAVPRSPTGLVSPAAAPGLSRPTDQQRAQAAHPGPDAGRPVTQDPATNAQNPASAALPTPGPASQDDSARLLASATASPELAGPGATSLPAAAPLNTARAGEARPKGVGVGAGATGAGAEAAAGAASRPARPSAPAPGADLPVPGLLRVRSRAKLERALEAATPEPLPLDARARLAPLLGADVSGVQLVRDARAAEALSELGADALALGDTVLLGPGQDLSSAGSLGLLAHELTHVLRERQPGFVPASMRPQAGAARLDEESLAERVEGRVRRDLQRPAPTPASTPQRPADAPAAPDPWNGLPAPWDPMPHWEAPARLAAPAASRGPAPAAPAAPSAAAPAASSARAASSSRSVAASEVGAGAGSAPAGSGGGMEVAQGPAVGFDHRKTNRNAPDLDRLAVQIYALLKRRLSDEMRRIR